MTFLSLYFIIKNEDFNLEDETRSGGGRSSVISDDIFHNILEED